MESLTKADWGPYYGNNHNKIDKPKIFAGGAVNLGNHIGKPLTQKLWEDIIHRLCASGICIYNENSFQWCIGWGAGHVIITLNNDDLVSGIEFTPYWRT